MSPDLAAPEVVARAAATRRRRRFDDIAWPLGIGLGTLLVWEGLCGWLRVKAVILPTPSEIIVSMVTHPGDLLENLWPSLYMIVLAFLLAVVGGVLFAILITYSRIVRKGLYPIIVVSQIVPKIAVAPLFIVWFGTGATSSLLLAFLISFFPMTINAAIGFQDVDQEVVNMARSFMGSHWQIFLKIRLPNAMPYLFGSMKVSITLAIIGVIVSEFVASQRGIGYLIKLSGGLLETPLMMASITVLSIAGLVLYGLIAWAEHYIIYWQPPSHIEGTVGG